MGKALDLIKMMESEDWELDFTRGGRKAHAFFSLVKSGQPLENPRDPEYMPSELRFEFAHYLDGEEEEITDLSPKEIQELEDRASEQYDEYLLYGDK